MFLKENNTFECKGHFENASITIEAKLSFLIYRKHYLSKLIIWDIAQKINRH